ncbi:hypothetical protein [Synechococcus sp. 1G10]|uniref:hypothetical protein n=1 Tax=Synechococcus sp. 1G10 TaxID=2025605 RepID=UPI0013031A4F|nr:hypothetical protein [Synechococcus sp. 1G10]
MHVLFDRHGLGQTPAAATVPIEASKGMLRELVLAIGLPVAARWRRDDAGVLI